MLGVAVLAFWHLRGKNRKSPNSEWKPLNQNVLWFLFVAKLFGPLVLFTAVNFKLPQYAPYDEIAVKACEVTASLVFYPPQSKYAAAMKGEYEILREVSGNYFKNVSNHLYPKMKKFVKM